MNHSEATSTTPHINIDNEIQRLDMLRSKVAELLHRIKGSEDNVRAEAFPVSPSPCLNELLHQGATRMEDSITATIHLIDEIEEILFS